MWVVPWRLDSVGRHQHLLHDPKGENEDNYGDSDLALVISYFVQFHHVEISKTNECGEDANDISFSSPLSTLTSHEILSDDHRSILVSFISEPWHIVESRIHDTSRANDPNENSDGKPHHLIHKEWIKLLDDVEQSSQNCEKQEVLGDDAE